jgi:hypothetical protein
VIALLALLAALQAPADFVHEEETGLLHFRYVWPAAVEREPPLRARLAREMAAARSEALADARAGRRRARSGTFLAHDYDQVWEMHGTGGVLLSLGSATYSFAGGAHGNHSMSAILWDLAAHRAVAVPAVLGRGLAGMSARYCAELDRQRAENRDDELGPYPGDPFTECPPLARQVLVPADSDGNGRLDALQVMLAPYLAGPYTEGEYIVAIPFTAEDLAAVPDRYRADFEVPGDRIRPLPDQ